MINKRVKNILLCFGCIMMILVTIYIWKNIYKLYVQEPFSANKGGRFNRKTKQKRKGCDIPEKLTIKPGETYYGITVNDGKTEAAIEGRNIQIKEVMAAHEKALKRCGTAGTYQPYGNETRGIIYEHQNDIEMLQKRSCTAEKLEEVNKDALDIIKKTKQSELIQRHTNEKMSEQDTKLKNIENE